MVYSHIVLSVRPFCSDKGVCTKSLCCLLTNVAATVKIAVGSYFSAITATINKSVVSEIYKVGSCNRLKLVKISVFTLHERGRYFCCCGSFYEFGCFVKTCNACLRLYTEGEAIQYENHIVEDMGA